MNSIFTVDFRSLAFWGGIPAFVMLVKYAAEVWTRKAPATGYASFLMWTVLDVLLVVNTIRANQSIWLPLGFLVGATLVTGAQFARGKWIWTQRETLAAVCAAVAFAFTFVTTGAVALFASVVAMTSAGIPILIDNVRTPVRETFGLWFATVVGCVMTYYGFERTEHSWILPLCSGTYNGIMSILVLRRPKPLESRAAAILAAT